MVLINRIKLAIKLIFRYRVPGKYYKVQKDDILLISYPKSGNTWLRFLFGNVMYSSGVDFKNIDKFIPDIYRTTKKEIEDLDSPRVIKSHEPFFPNNSKVVYIYRDPRDVVISYYYWYKKFNRLKGESFEFFFNSFLEGNVSYGLWSEHLKGWREAAEKRPRNVYMVKYETLKEDTLKEFKKILQFCDLDYSDERILEAVNKSEFKNMKKMEEKQSKDSIFKDTNLNISFVRSGKSEWKDVLSEDQIKRLNRVFELDMIEYK